MNDGYPQVSTAIDPCPVCKNRLIGFNEADFVSHLDSDGVRFPEIHAQLHLTKEPAEEWDDE